MRTLPQWSALLALVCVLPGAGCKAECEGLDPQLEIVLKLGSGVKAGDVNNLLLTARLEGGKCKSRPLSLGQAGLSGDRGQFVLRFDKSGLTSGTNLWLDVIAQDGAGKTVARGQPASNPVSIQPNGCNFVEVTLGTNLNLKSCSSGTGNIPTLALSKQTAEIEIHGGAASDKLGSVAVCDLTGDGDPELVVAAPAAKGASDQVNKGRVYVLMAQKQSGSRRVVDLGKSLPNSLIIYGADLGDGLGTSLACGDFNSDGAQDLAIGAPSAGNGAGKVYVLQGENPLDPLREYLHQSHSLLEISGGGPQDSLGQALVWADMENTGEYFLAIGAPGYSGPPSSSAADGGATPDAGSSPDAGPSPDAGSVLDAGADWGVSSRAKAGAVFIIPPKTIQQAFKQTKKLSLARPGPFMLMQGGLANEALGSSLAAGFINSDKHEDLVAGGLGVEESGGDDWGPVRVLRGRLFNGKFPRFDCVYASKSPHTMTLWGGSAKSNTGFGRAVAVGDLNLDNYDEIIVGAPLEGKAYIFEGGADVLPATTEPAKILRVSQQKNLAVISGPANAFFANVIKASRRTTTGRAVDLLIGAEGYDKDRGAVYWMRRTKTGFTQGEDINATIGDDVLLLILGAAAGDRLGHQMAGGPISLDDKIPDILISANHATASGRTLAGTVYGKLSSK